MRSGRRPAGTPAVSFAGVPRPRLLAGVAAVAVVVSLAAAPPTSASPPLAATGPEDEHASGTAAARPKCMGKTATIVGTKRADRIRGTKRADVIVAGGGNDKIRGVGGNDLICAGGGNDTVLAGGGADRVKAGGGSDIVLGGPGRDVISGQGGPDGLLGGGGADRLDGGKAVDLLAYLGAKKAVHVDLAKGRATGGAGNDRFTGLEGLIDTPHADTLLGSKRNEAFFSAGGADRVNGRGGGDYVIYTLYRRGVVVDLGKGKASGGMRLSKIENVYGSAYDDTIAGTARFNELDGQAGNDSVDGNGGGDMCFAEQVTGCQQQGDPGVPPVPTEPPPGLRGPAGQLGTALLRYQLPSSSPATGGGADATTGRASQYGTVECPAMSRAAWAASWVQGVGFIQTESADGIVLNWHWMYYNGAQTWLWNPLHSVWWGPYNESPSINGIFVGERGRARAWWWSSEYGQWFALGACIGNGVPLGFNFS